VEGEGAKVWLVPDCYLPEPGNDPLKGHEAICLLNTGTVAANVTLDFYFEDREPIKDVKITLGAERTWHVRLDDPEKLGVAIPRLVPYAIRVRSDVNIVVQYSRMDTSQTNLALMTTIAWPVPENGKES
jgi:Uncharacterized protein conserved in bacteria